MVGLIAIVIDRSCAASIITWRSWCGSVITRAALKWHGVSVHSSIAIGPYHLYGWVIPSVVDVMGFNGVRASVRRVHPGAGVQSPPESVHPGAATGTITRLGPCNYFDYFLCL